MFNCAVSLAGDCADIRGVKRLCALADVILAADGGADNLIKGGIIPDWVIGDNDSAHMSLPDKTSQLLFPQDKDYTDGELAISLALFLAASSEDINDKKALISAVNAEDKEEFAQSLTKNFRQAHDITDLSFLILFPFGKRVDHSWTNVLVRIIAGTVSAQAAFAPELLSASILTEVAEPIFSAIPLDDNVKGFTLSGLKWDLDRAELPYNRATAVSNRPLEGEKADPVISLEDGTVMLMLTRAD